MEGLMANLPVRFLLTAAVALLCGVIAVRLKVPVGGMIGGLFGVAVFNILTNLAYAGGWLNVIVQSLSGAYIGLSIRKRDLPQFKIILAPAAMMVVALLLLNMTLGYTITAVSDMNLITALLATSPGGVTDIALLSGDMGANQAQVTLMHLLRLTTVVGVCLSMLRQLSARFDRKKSAPADFGAAEAETEEKVPPSMPMTVLIAVIFGTLGYFSRLPAGTLAFSMMAVAFFNVRTGKAYIRPDFRKYVQMMAGLIIGKGVTMLDVISIPTILLPAVLMLLGFFGLNICLSFVLARFTKLDYTTALFATSPGGVADMALMSMDLGGDAPKTACMQMCRLFSSILIFPHFIRLAVDLTP